MKLIIKIKKAEATQKTKIWLDAELMVWEAEDLVKEMILSLPGSYKIHDHQYGTNLGDKIFEIYGLMPSLFISEKILLGLQAMNPKRVYASFTLGLDVVEVTK